MRDWKTVTIPPKMARLEKDRRGYPIPYIVVRDNEGRPHFTINDHAKTVEVITKGLCALCGLPFGDLGSRAFVGGPPCFIHPHGAFLDPPAHWDCARYAIRVCPYLAAPSYGRRLDDKTLDPAKAEGMTVIAHEEAVDSRPDVFMLGRTRVIQLIKSQTEGGFLMHVPREKWLEIEFWRHGVQLTEDEATPMVVARMKEFQ